MTRTSDPSTAHPTAAGLQLAVASPPLWLNRELWPWPARLLPLDEGRLAVTEVGHEHAGQPPVVLVHGTPTWSLDWRHVLSGLQGQHRLLAVDHLGFGLSDRPLPGTYRPEDHARRFAAAMALLVPTGKVHLVVHDFGGPIALGWALDNPERLASLCLVNTWAWSLAEDPRTHRQAKLARGRLARWLYRYLNASQRLILPAAYGNRQRLTRALHQQYLANFADADSREQVLFALAEALLGSDGWYRQLWARLGRLRDVPTAILWGMRDPAFGQDCLARWQNALPHAAVVRFDVAGHWPHEEEPSRFVEALQAHVTTAGGRPVPGTMS